MYYVYVLRSLVSGNFYKGITKDLDRRIFEHERGKSFTTGKQLPLQLIHVEIVENRQKARELEKYFKSGYGREIIDEIYKTVFPPGC